MKTDLFFQMHKLFKMPPFSFERFFQLCMFIYVSLEILMYNNYTQIMALLQISLQFMGTMSMANWSFVYFHYSELEANFSASFLHHNLSQTLRACVGPSSSIFRVETLLHSARSSFQLCIFTLTYWKDGGDRKIIGSIWAHNPSVCK